MSQEYVLTEDDLIVSKTDLQGNIIFVNDDFVRVSGFSKDELLGQPHNIVRHADMPKVAFADLWRTLKAGRPWTGLVKNRCKNNDYYWVLANATPFYEGKQLAGYMSVRTKPTREQVNAAQKAYLAVSNDTKNHLTIENGQVIKNTFFSRFSLFFKQASLKMLFFSASLFSIAMFATIALQEKELSSITEAALALGLLANAFVMRLTIVKVTSPLNRAVNYLTDISQGHFGETITIRSRTEMSSMLMAIKAMQIQLNFRERELHTANSENLRYKIALDNMSAAVMIANEHREIIYANNTVLKLLSNAERNIQQQLPHFSVKTLLGTNIDVFHQNPDKQATILASFQNTLMTTAILGGKHLVICVDPIISKTGQRLGQVAVWRDRTFEVGSEFEVDKVLNRACNGDFSGRIDTQGMEGFYLQASKSINTLMETTQRAIDDILQLSAGLAHGDLTLTMQNSYTGTFGVMAGSMNETVQHLKGLLSETKIAISVIAGASSEIAAGNNDLAHRTCEQAASIEETAASMEQLSATIKQNMDNAKHASQLAIDASETASQGLNVVENVSTTMTSINESSHRIVDIVSVIDDIAFQTNILALNAAVEAARAGEKGQGFAVVATEVRNLAQRAANAANEVKMLVMDSVERVNSGSKQVSQAGKTMGDIVASIQEVTTIMADIAIASQEQSAGINQIYQAVTQMDSMTQQNAALVEEAAAAAESLDEQTQSLAREMTNFRT